jgi:hypothetical protein
MPAYQSDEVAVLIENNLELRALAYDGLPDTITRQSILNRLWDLDPELKWFELEHPKLWPVVKMRMETYYSWREIGERLGVVHVTAWRNWRKAVGIITERLNGVTA